MENPSDGIIDSLASRECLVSACTWKEATVKHSLGCHNEESMLLKLTLMRNDPDTSPDRSRTEAVHRPSSNTDYPAKRTIDEGTMSTKEGVDEGRKVDKGCEHDEIRH